LRNDQRVQGGFLEHVSISSAQQDVYMTKFASRYLVALIADQPAGYAGSIDNDIRVCTHPEFQGRGVGRALINAIMERFPESQARIKPGNHASEALFLACGFKQVGESDGLLIFRRADLAAG
jgi:GNAT superfamily N-acetyltransferase